MITPNLVERHHDEMTGHFYDDLAATYHLMFADWDASMARQAEALDGMLDGFLGGRSAILDCACGIGTQAIGLAARGHDVVGTDLSPVAAARALVEASNRGVSLPTAAADMRALPFPDHTFDVVVAADNAVPHLLTAADVVSAVREMRRVLRPGGRLVLTTRDYDAIRREHPLSTPPQVSQTSTGRVITFQLWHWHDDGERYDLEHFQLHDGATRIRTTTYWALTRSELTALVAEAGFVDITWPDIEFFQPVLSASSG